VDSLRSCRFLGTQLFSPCGNAPVKNGCPTIEYIFDIAPTTIFPPLITAFSILCFSKLFLQLSGNISSKANMAYGKDDELAINTIRLLAVSSPHFKLLESCLARLRLLLFPSCQLFKVFLMRHLLMTCSIDRSMPPSRPIPVIPEPQWAWHQSPTFSSINS